MTFRGSLAEVSLADILQLVAVSNRTGILALRMGGSRGEIHIDQGQISHAVTERLSGDAAFYELARWTSGEFEFAQDVPLGPRTIEKTNPELLAEGGRQAAEWRMLGTRIASTRMVPVFSGQGPAGVSLTADEWAVVSRVDERRSLEEIAAALGVSTLDVCRVVFTLLSSGVLSVRDDLRKMPVERLRRLNNDELGRVADGIQRTALELAPGREKHLALEGALRLFRAEHEAGRTLDALINLVREVEKSITALLGQEAAAMFLDRVYPLMEAGEADRPAPPPPAPALRIERPPLDLAAARQRVSEIVYRGLGPNGEAHNLKIEKSKTAADLRQLATVCRDLLAKLGKPDLAAQLTAEIEQLI